MRRAIALALSLALSGCAPRVQVGRGSYPLHDWASVVAIKRPVTVRVTVKRDIEGFLYGVTDSTLTIFLHADRPLLTIGRAEVSRVAVSAPKRWRWRHWLTWPLTVGILSGLGGALVGAAMKDAKVSGISLLVVGTSSIALLYLLNYHWADREWRVVYVRP